jgi:serine/threonine protein kinase
MAKVLVVDDDPLLSGTLEDWLLGEKHNVEVADTGFKGWEKLQKNEYDFVILDWDLPDLNGVDILKMYRGAGNTTPVLLLTGRSSLDDKEQGLDSGADDYLTKPFHVKELAARMRAAMRKGEARQPKPKALGEGNEEMLKSADLDGTSLAAHYEFIATVGSGGVGVVFKARHPRLDKLVAIKMLQRAEAKDETVSRFEREAQIISRLEHPGIATVHDFGVTERRQPYMVMEFIEGRGLEAVLAERDFLPLPEALDIALQICDALAYAHEHGILHRDIKPSNVMLKDIPGKAPIIKILDFGCAKRQEEGIEKAPALTQTGQIIGSPPYMSPEQIKGKTLSERSDLYSFGCLLYETLVGYPPHSGETAVEIIFKHLDEPVIPIRAVRPELNLPQELDHLLSNALALDPSMRYGSMREIQKDLERIRAGLTAPKEATKQAADDKHSDTLKNRLKGIFNRFHQS